MPVIDARIDHCGSVRSRAGRNIPGGCCADVGAGDSDGGLNDLAGVLESPQLPEARVIGDGSRVDDVVGFGVLDIGSRRQLADQGGDILPRGVEAEQSGSAYHSDSSISSAVLAWRTDWKVVGRNFTRTSLAAASF